MTRSELYGSGVFTTTRIIDGKPWLWEKHWRRLAHDAERLGLELGHLTQELVRKELEYALDIDELQEGRARITLHDTRPSIIWPGVETPDEPTTLSVVTGELREITRPFRLALSPARINSTSPVAGLKTCNYLEQTMSLDEARLGGANEAIRINERGQITSACMANVFWLSDGRLFTPALSTGCLPGTTRELVIESLEVAEVEAQIDELRKADAIVLTSAGLGVVQVDEFERQKMLRLDHEITRLIPDGK